MIELADQSPTVNVVPAEYKRLLGYPAHQELEGRARELADWAASWYSAHGRPWIFARTVDEVEIEADLLRLDGREFNSRELLSNLHKAEAHAVVVAAVSAGSELETAAQQAWREEKPDEYFFLEVYGSAVVEHLVTVAGAQVCDWAEGAGMVVLPHYSPGYGEWSVAEQPSLMEVIRGSGRLPGPLEALDSGMLRPKKSLLAVFGVTASMDRAKQLAALVPCDRCSYSACQYRRTEYRSADDLPGLELASSQRLHNTFAARTGAQPQYKINRRALDRWANERLTITPCDDGTIDVVFKHEGTTCSNTGRPLFFDYHVRLSSSELGYRILEERCAPTANDFGYRSMCSYVRDPKLTMAVIADEKPLLGSSLDEVLTWQRASAAASCYCDRMSRLHMWGQVLETIHYALHRDGFMAR